MQHQQQRPAAGRPAGSTALSSLPPRITAPQRCCGQASAIGLCCASTRGCWLASSSARVSSTPYRAHWCMQGPACMCTAAAWARAPQPGSLPAQLAGWQRGSHVPPARSKPRPAVRGSVRVASLLSTAPVLLHMQVKDSCRSAAHNLRTQPCSPPARRDHSSRSQRQHGASRA